MNGVLVRKSVTVAASQATAFRVFTADMSKWWPLATHHLLPVECKEAIVEPRVGGRWYERGVDGSECDWGRVIAWEPSDRLVLSWEITADWKADSAIYTEVEVRFTPIAGGTRVDLEHRKLEAYGEAAEAMRGVFESESGWTGMLRMYMAIANQA